MDWFSGDPEPPSVLDGAEWPDAARQTLALGSGAAGLAAGHHRSAAGAALGEVLIDAALLRLMAQLAVRVAPTLQAETGRRFRQVSVLFLDIVGSTQLIERIDPKKVQPVVDGALAVFTQLVQQHGGEVLRYAGDNIKAAFGAGGTREDDAEQ